MHPFDLSELPKSLQVSSNIFLIGVHFHVSGIAETCELSPSGDNPVND